MVNQQTIEATRSVLTGDLGIALQTIGGSFQGLGAELKQTTVSAESRARHLLSEHGCKVWSGIWASDAAQLLSALKEFDRIVEASMNGEARYEFSADRESYQGELDRAQCHDFNGQVAQSTLRGVPARAVKYLHQAGFTLNGKFAGMCLVLSCKR